MSETNLDIQTLAYPDNKSCDSFLDGVMDDTKFTGYDQAFDDSVTNKRQAMKDFICNSGSKAKLIVERVRDIILQLLDRTLMIPALIHTNNMLWKRGELLKSMVDKYGKLSTKLTNEQRLLLEMMVYQASQVHYLMQKLGLQYDVDSNKFLDGDNRDVDTTTSTFYLMAQPKFAQLIEALTSVSSGEMFGQDLAVRSYPQMTLKFPKDADLEATKGEFVNLLAKQLKVDASVLTDLVTVTKGSTRIRFAMGDNEATKAALGAINSDERTARIAAQRALLQIAFMKPTDGVGGVLAQLWEDTPQMESPIPFGGTASDAARELEQQFGLQFDFAAAPDVVETEDQEPEPEEPEVPEEEDAGPKHVDPDVDVAGGAADAAAALKAEAESKAAQLAKIRKLIESNDVKEFIRVRPYVDKDERATELQLQTVDKSYVRSADPSDALGQLVTRVEYKGSCMDFSGVFAKKDKDDKFFESFQAFIPKNKVPDKSKWFATVNGGVFPEFLSYNERGVKVVPTDFLKVRKFLDFKPAYQWVDHPTETDRKWVQPKQTRKELASGAKDQLRRIKQFKDLYSAWKSDTINSRAELERLIPQTQDDAKKRRFQQALSDKPQPTEDAFIEEYLNVRTASDAINIEFVDTVWPVLSVFFGPEGADGQPLYDQTKNVVAFFYGASGSGKTFTAEAILDKVFDTIKDHPDEFVMKIVTDYNNVMYDYYSTGGNLKMVHNYELQYPQTKAFNFNAERALKKQQFSEMAKRAQLLTFDCRDSRSVTKAKEVMDVKKDFFEGNVAQSGCDKAPLFSIRRTGDKRIDLASIKTYNPEYLKTWSKTPEGHYATSLRKEGYKPGPGQKVYKPPKEDMNIPKDAARFALFKKDFERRVREFRSVTDTGLNPESSRSHLLYIIQRKTKNGGKTPMVETEKGALFVLADFAGTEDLNYLMNEDAWKAWSSWKDNEKHGGKGSCTVAGKEVKQDWACLDLAALTNASTDGQGGKVKSALRKALFEGWRNIKIKTLVASDIADMPTVPTDPKKLEEIKQELRKKWLSNLSKTYVTTGAMNAAGQKLDISDPEQASQGVFVYFNKDEVTEGAPQPLKGLLDSAKDSTGNFSVKKAKKAGLIEDNTHRFSQKDEENEDIVVNMVLAMHAESRHINDSLKEIAALVNAQREATKKDPTAKADTAAMEKSKQLTKVMVTDILAPAVTAGSTAVTFGAGNPRRANDFDTYKTLESITSMRGECLRVN